MYWAANQVVARSDKLGILVEIAWPSTTERKPMPFDVKQEKAIHACLADRKCPMCDAEAGFEYQMDFVFLSKEQDTGMTISRMDRKFVCCNCTGCGFAFLLDAQVAKIPTSH